MLDKISFLAFKKELFSSLNKYSQLDSINTTILKLEAVNFKADNPKDSYKELYDILATHPKINVSQPITTLVKLSSLITSPTEVNANRVLNQAKQQAEAYHNTAMVLQDCRQNGIPLNLAPIVNFENLNTGNSTHVSTRPKI